jgi:beta-glucosidase
VIENSDAIIETFNGGDLGGLCAAELIAGKFNPSGKLPISFPRASGQVPCYYNTYPGWHGGKYMDAEEGSRYDFGYGLSYTKYEYANLAISSDTAKAGDTLTVSVDVTNIGDMDGCETVEMYYNDLYSSVLTPIRQLCGFKKVFVKAGETVRVELSLAANDLALVNAKCETVLEPGDFEILVGGSLDTLQAVALKITE